MERLGGMADHWIFRYLNSSDRQMIMANVDRRSSRPAKRALSGIDERINPPRPTPA